MADSLGCEVRWYLYAFKHLQPRYSNKYLRIGTILHTALAYHHVLEMDRKPEWFVKYPDMLTALEEDARGKPAELRNALEFIDAYKYYYTGSPWVPIACEEEFIATVGALDPAGEDEPTEDLTFLDARGEPSIVHLPSLNDEVVSCRPDLIIIENGRNIVVDHKSGGSARDGSGRLPILNPQYPDFTYFWQAMVNLHIVRQQMPIEEFVLNRVKRDRPFDFSRDTLTIPEKMYGKVPAAIRASVKRDRALRRKVARGEAMTPHPFECETKWGSCPYSRLCYAPSQGERDLVLSAEFDFSS